MLSCYIGGIRYKANHLLQQSSIDPLTQTVCLRCCKPVGFEFCRYGISWCYLLSNLAKQCMAKPLWLGRTCIFNLWPDCLRCCHRRCVYPSASGYCSDCCFSQQQRTQCRASSHDSLDWNGRVAGTGFTGLLFDRLGIRSMAGKFRAVVTRRQFFRLL